MAVPRISRATNTRRTRLAVNALTSPTSGYTGLSGTLLRAIPADGSATATTNNRLIRAIVTELTDKGILTKG